MLTTRVVHEEAGNWRRPVFQDADKPTRRNIAGDLLFIGTAQTYFDAAYEMDAEKFASIFHPSSSVTKVGDDGNVGVTPIAMWLAAVRNMKAPKQQGFERDDQILSIDVERELALLKLKLQIPPRYFTDMLSCLKVNGTWKIVQKVMTSKT
jgi:Putative lumazine-binding